MIFYNTLQPKLANECPYRFVLTSVKINFKLTFYLIRQLGYGIKKSVRALAIGHITGINYGKLIIIRHEWLTKFLVVVSIWDNRYFIFIYCRKQHFHPFTYRDDLIGFVQYLVL